MCACVLYHNTKFWSQFYISDLFGNRDGSDQSAHLCNLIRLFFFLISSEMDVHTQDLHWITESTKNNY